MRLFSSLPLQATWANALIGDLEAAESPRSAEQLATLRASLTVRVPALWRGQPDCTFLLSLLLLRPCVAGVEPPRAAGLLLPVL